MASKSTSSKVLCSTTSLLLSANRGLSKSSTATKTKIRTSTTKGTVTNGVGTNTSTKTNTVPSQSRGRWNCLAAGVQMVGNNILEQSKDNLGILAARTLVHGTELTSNIGQVARSKLTSMNLPTNNSTSMYEEEKFTTENSEFNNSTNNHSILTDRRNLEIESTPDSFPNSVNDASSTIMKNFVSLEQDEPKVNFVLNLSEENTLSSSSTISNKDKSTEHSLQMHDWTHMDRQPHQAMQQSSQNATQNTVLTDQQTEEQPQVQHIPEGAAVPSTRIGRALGFANLGVGLAVGMASEGISRVFGSKQSSTTSQPSSLIVNESNSDRIASTLCRMRGAALKLGQMLSIQDESLLPPPLTRALKQVRHGAEAMPRYQLEQQMTKQLGSNWKDLFITFDALPFAAASIGQVHRATISDPTSPNQIRHVTVKVQYPGVAQSIESDLRNLAMLVSWTGVAPKGLFLDNVIRVAQKELKSECDYRKELKHQQLFQSLVHSDPILQRNHFVVPDSYPELSSNEVLTSEYRTGATIDNVSKLSQNERNRIGRTMLYLTMQELFVWRVMQTDPNWGNFLYDNGTRTTSLIDFGATRTYSKEFVDGYLRIVWASANRDKDALMEQSYRMKFLTGNENQQMIYAHQQSGFTVGEPFWMENNYQPNHDGSIGFDFRGSNISTRMGEHTAVFLQHRLTAPPEEIYSLHRKLAGAYLLCIKIGAVVQCRDLLEKILEQYTFDDGLPHPLDVS